MVDSLIKNARTTVFVSPTIRSMSNMMRTGGHRVTVVLTVLLMNCTQPRVKEETRVTWQGHVGHLVYVRRCLMQSAACLVTAMGSKCWIGANLVRNLGWAIVSVSFWACEMKVKLKMTILSGNRPYYGAIHLISAKNSRCRFYNWLIRYLSVSLHVQPVITSCAQTLYALRVLRAHGCLLYTSDAADE